MKSESTTTISLPRLSPSAEAWMDQAVALANQFGDCLGECSPDARALDTAIIYTAAASIWHTSPGAPHWSQLTVDTLLSQIAELQGWQDKYIGFAVTLDAFYSFLIDEGIVEPHQVEGVTSALELYAHAALMEMTIGRAEA